MSRNRDYEDEYIRDVLERFTADELLEILGLTEIDIVDNFHDRIIASAEIKAVLGM